MIANVTLVQSPSLNLQIWTNTTRKSMKDKEITNVILVENPSHDYGLFGDTHEDNLLYSM